MTFSEIREKRESQVDKKTELKDTAVIYGTFGKDGYSLITTLSSIKRFYF